MASQEEQKKKLECLKTHTLQHETRLPKLIIH